MNNIIISNDKRVEMMFVYEVNLIIKKDVFNQHKQWLLDHFHEMVIDNEFSKLHLFFVENTDPIDDAHIREQKIVAQYYVSCYEILQRYLEKQAARMRSQVYEKLGNNYLVNRRIFKIAEIYVVPNEREGLKNNEQI